MDKTTEKTFELRHRILSAIIALSLIVLVGRLAFLQVSHGTYYEELATEQRVRILPIAHQRGSIFARDGEILATNRPGFTVSLVDIGRDKLADVVPRLAGILDIKEEDIRNKIDQHRFRKYDPIRLKEDVDYETLATIEERRMELPGVIIETIPVRYYPNGHLASHIIGHLGQIDENELKSWEGNYRGGDLVGKTGIELVYEAVLRGKNGGQQVEVNRIGRITREFGKEDPVPGSNLYLTISKELQQVAEEALRERIKQLKEDEERPATEIQGGAAVVLDVRTGAILAMASYPDYDPNWFVPNPRASLIDEAKKLPQPYFNRTVQGTYQVGSTFKPLVLIAALEEGVVESGAQYVCEGVYWTIWPKPCWKAHGRLDLVRAIRESCNVVFYELGRLLGIDRLSVWAERFGLGQDPGLTDLNEVAIGRVPSREWKKEYFAGDPENEIWYPVETLDAAIGQGYHLYSPLQMAMYAEMIATRGVQYRPYLVGRVESPDGELVEEHKPEVLRTLDVSDSTWDLVHRAMAEVTGAPHGTAEPAFRGFPVKTAGKTGTAEVAGREAHSWFIGFAPLDEPEIAVAVVLEHAGRGAALVARDVMEGYFEQNGRQD